MNKSSVARLVFALAIAAFALPAFAQSPEPTTPPAQPTTPPPQPTTPPPQQEKAPARPMRDRWFFGGGIGASFGTVDYVEVAPLVGMRVVPRLDLGLQPFFRWTSQPGLETSDYGARLFARVRVVSSFFLEADYQYTNYEYPNSLGGTTRDANNAFLAGAGYVVPLGRNVGMFFSALYDFSYNSNNSYYPYDSPVQFQVGVSVGF